MESINTNYPWGTTSFMLEIFGTSRIKVTVALACMWLTSLLVGGSYLLFPTACRGCAELAPPAPWRRSAGALNAN